MNEQDPALLPLGTKIDQYTISRVLGRGGFGITYLVRDEGLDKDFALKEFFPEDLVRREGTSLRFTARPNSESDYRWGLKKFHDEARLLAQFHHCQYRQRPPRVRVQQLGLHAARLRQRQHAREMAAGAR